MTENDQTRDILEQKNEIIKRVNIDWRISDGFGIVIRSSFFDLYPRDELELVLLIVVCRVIPAPGRLLAAVLCRLLINCIVNTTVKQLSSYC